jgi:hypothetical protein
MGCENQKQQEKHMRKIFWLCMMVGLALFTAQAQNSPAKERTIASEMNANLQGVEGEFVPAAEAMPEDKFNFAPTGGEFTKVRTFAQQIKHVAAVNYMLGAAIQGEKSPVELGSENGPDSLKSKAEIVKFLKDSYAYLHKAVETITAANVVGEVESPFGGPKLTRLTVASIGVAHSFDHYGQMAVYLRMNGIIPPASRQ